MKTYPKWCELPSQCELVECVTFAFSRQEPGEEEVVANVIREYTDDRSVRLQHVPHDMYEPMVRRLRML